jgi:predicted Mrr-cat superfamily restriction endonuclease
MTRYWVIRLDRNESEYINHELSTGRLRQGWGYSEDQDLELIRRKVADGISLNPDERICRIGNRMLHQDEPDGMKAGDIVIIPNIPSTQSFQICRIIGNYRYEIESIKKDYGHIRDVELLTKQQNASIYCKDFSARLRQTLTNRRRMWNIDQYKTEFDSLLQAINNGADLSERETKNNKLFHIHEQLRKDVEQHLKQKYYGAEFENPVELLLQQIYGKDNVKKCAGPNERGADFICTLIDGLGQRYDIAVQVKMWEKTIEDMRPLEQIAQATNDYEFIACGIILTTAEAESNDFQKRREILRRDIGIPIEIIFKDKLFDLFLRYLPEIS